MVTLILNRPEAANSLDTELVNSLQAALDGLAADHAAKVVVVTGAGRFFCAGADLREAGPVEDRTRRGRCAFESLAQLPLPTIAAVNGPAMGGGAELSLACDIRILGSTATIGFPEIKFGSLPLAGGPTRLQELIGPAAARMLVLTGRALVADDALRLGLANEIAEDGSVLAAGLELAHEMAQYARYALTAAKTAMVQSLGIHRNVALSTEYLLYDQMGSPEQRLQARRDAARRDPTYARIFTEPS